jgi:hypothetical protein
MTRGTSTTGGARHYVRAGGQTDTTHVRPVFGIHGAHGVTRPTTGFMV